MNIFFFQPYMTKYREDLFSDIAHQENVNLKVICGNTPDNFQTSTTYDFPIEKHEKTNFKKFIFFRGINYKEIFKKNNVIIHFADFKYINIYIILFARMFYGFHFFLHGQGGYKKKGFFQKIVYFIFILISDGYICYNEYCSTQLKKKMPKFLHKKISFINNTLYLCPVKNINVDFENKIAFIGRIRPRSGLEELLEAVSLLNNDHYKASVEIIGTGDDDYMNLLKSRYKFANLHGSIYEQHDIKKVLASCAVGVYGGDAGLSVVHYMSLGLPVIVHDEISKHMGPEPSYVVSNYNGLLFKRNNVRSLSVTIDRLLSERDERNKLAANSLLTFNNLMNPSMGNQFIQITNRVKK